MSASILGFDGQLSVFAPYDGPCYRCLYPTPPPAELAPSCGANGVLGVLPGMMGLLQATEVIKLVTGAGEPLIGRLLLYDALGATFTELKVTPRPGLPDLLARPGRRSPTTRWASSRTTRRSAPAPARVCPRRMSHGQDPTRSCAPPPAARRKSPPRAATSARSCVRSPTQHPDTERQLFGEDGSLNRYVNVYLNDEDVRVLDGLDTPVKDVDTLVILPAMAGGAQQVRPFRRARYPPIPMG